MDRQFSSAIIGTFRNGEPAQHAAALRAFRTDRWERNLDWLDASGLALYFLKQLRAGTIEGSVPKSILARLQQRYADNQRRTTCLFEEFVRLNTALSDAQVRYVNLKGFTLAPEYCPDISLRYQLDCDFLVHAADANKCEPILYSLGYAVVAANSHVIEFKTGAAQTPHISDLYSPGSERAVELHLCDSSRPDRHPSLLERARPLSIRDGAYPALAADDMFVSQASHLFRHLRSEWTRVSWLWELRHCVTKLRQDASFWQAVRMRATESTLSAVAIGTSIRIVEKAFGEFVSPELGSWCSEQLPASVGLWIERYGDEVLLADFPGSKLYLILEQALCAGEPTRSMIHRRLFPMRAPARFAANPQRGFLRRVIAMRARCGYFLFRLRFHISAGLQYFIESRRWKRLRHPQAVKDVYRHADCAANAAD